MDIIGWRQTLQRQVFYNNNQETTDNKIHPKRHKNLPLLLHLRYSAVIQQNLPSR